MVLLLPFWSSFLVHKCCQYLVEDLDSFGPVFVLYCAAVNIQWQFWKVFVCEMGILDQKIILLIYIIYLNHLQILTKITTLHYKFYLNNLRKSSTILHTKFYPN